MEKDKRIRLLKIWEILRQETDENNPMGTETLRNKIAEYGIHSDRRTIYDDIRVLNDFGYEIIKKRSTSNEYYVMDRTFDIPEVQILMDAVQAASFVTTKKTEKLIDKIAQLAGSQRAEVLKKNTVEFHTPKSNNEDIYYIINEISEAITTGKQVEFYYFDYDINHKRVYRKNKKRYIVNPLSTVFCLDNYYLMCYDDKHGTIAHYRVDRMDTVNVSQRDITETEQSKWSCGTKSSIHTMGGASSNEHTIMLGEIEKKDVCSLDLIFENCESLTVFNNEIQEIDLVFEKELEWGSSKFYRCVKEGYIKLKLRKDLSRASNLFGVKSLKRKNMERRLCGKGGCSTHDICRLHFNLYHAGYGDKLCESIECEEIKPQKEVERLIKREEHDNAVHYMFESGYAKLLKDRTVVLTFGSNAKRSLKAFC